MPKVSIIIPAYNANMGYMKVCMKSVLCQTYEDIEVIIVDDGSAKEYGAFYDEYTKKDYRVKVIHQKNQGVSVARNNGTKNATGDYIMYVDADDIVAPFMVESAISCALKYDADFVIGMNTNIWTHDDFLSHMNNGKEFLLNSDKSIELLKKTMFYNSADEEFAKKNENGYFSRGPIAKIIRKEIADTVKFPIEMAIGEDFVWNLRLINKCNTICLKKEIWYGYLQQFSTVRGYRSDRELMSKRFLLAIENENKDIVEKYPDAYYSCIATEFYVLLRYNLMSPQCGMTQKEKHNYVKKVLSTEPWSNIVNKRHRKNFSFSTKLFLVVCDLNLWTYFLKAWIYKEKYFGKRFG